MRIRHLPGVVATLVVTPALIVLPVQPLPATAEGTPVPTAERRVELVAPSAPQVGDADVASRADVALAKTQAARLTATAAAPTSSASRPTASAPAATPQPAAAPVVLEASAPQTVPAGVAVAGVVYGSAPAPGTVVQYRTTPAGSPQAWGDWQPIDSDGEQRQVDRTGDGTPVDARGGSDPIVLTDTAQVQVRVLGPAGAATPSARLSIIDPGAAAQDAAVGEGAAAIPGAAQAAVAMPTIHTRREWGADESWRKSPPEYTTVRGVIVHHTAGTNDYTRAQVPAILRGIYAFHTKDRGWNDIAYNVLVDKWGRMWEGRAGGLSRGVLGAHALAWNNQTMGVSVLGDFNKASVPTAAVNSVARVIAWKAGVHGFDPDAKGWVNGHWVPIIQGHRDVGNTTCPGTSLYAKLPAIRRLAASLAGKGGGGGTSGGEPVTTPPATLRGNDVLMRSSSNALLRSSPIGTTGLTFASRVSDRDWSDYDVVMSAGDWTGDRRGDVVARHRGTKALHLYAGTSSGGVDSSYRNLGSGWGGMSALSAGADLTGDGWADLLAVIGRTGQLYVYPGNGRGGFLPRRLYGTGWGTMRDVVALGDWDGDRKGDILGVLRDGTAYVYPGNGRGGFRGGRVKIATPFDQWPTLVGLPGTAAIFGLDSAGNGYMIRRHGTSTVRSTKVAPNFRGLEVYAG